LQRGEGNKEKKRRNNNYLNQKTESSWEGELAQRNRYSAYRDDDMYITAVKALAKRVLQTCLSGAPFFVVVGNYYANYLNYDGPHRPESTAQPIKRKIPSGKCRKEKGGINLKS
jgi:hypothetical protein